jgi:[acyl-carrier-protein] S-malonyltransferase
MARDAANIDGTMVAVFGLGEPELDAICSHASQQAGTHAQIANLNAPAQVVISGERRAIELAADLARAAGAQRVVPLNVAGPFHSTYMERAARDFASVCSSTVFRPPRVPLVLNTTGTPTCDPEALRLELAAQITRRVQWVATLQCLAHLGCTLFVELGPGHVLTNLVRRVLPEAIATAAGTPEALAGVAGLLKGQHLQ